MHANSWTCGGHSMCDHWKYSSISSGLAPKSENRKGDAEQSRKGAGGRNRTRPGGRNRTRNVRSSFTTGGRNRTRMCQKRDRRGTLERVETERKGVKTERGVHFLWQAQACGSVTCKEMVRYYFTFYVYVTGGALWEGRTRMRGVNAECVVHASWQAQHCSRCPLVFCCVYRSLAKTWLDISCICDWRPTLNPSLSLKVCAGATVLCLSFKPSPTPVPTLNPSPHPKPQSHPSLSLKVCVGATVLCLSFKPSPTPVPTLNPSPTPV